MADSAAATVQDQKVHLRVFDRHGFSAEGIRSSFRSASAAGLDLGFGFGMRELSV